MDESKLTKQFNSNHATEIFKIEIVVENKF